MQLGELYLNIGTVQKAIDTLTESLKLEKDPANPGVIRTKIALVKVCLLQKDIDSAERYVNEVLAEVPNSADGHYLKGSINLLKGEGINAVSEFRTVINEKPEFLEGYLRLSEAHFLNREFELAADTLRRALKINENSIKLLYALAKTYAAKRDFDAAHAQFNRILEIEPDNIRARSDRGDLLVLDVESSIDDKPLINQQGVQYQVLHDLSLPVPGFGEQLIGMKRNEEKEFKVEPKDGYGEPNPDLKKKIPRDQLPKEPEPKKGMILSIGLPDGRKIPAKIDEVGEKEVTLDLNHPLCGKTLTFKIKVVEIIS